MDDKRIVALYFAGDEAAITRTAEKYGPSLRRIAYGILEDRGSADECENDTYLAAWNAIPPKDPSGYYLAFLSGITRRLAIDMYRYNSRKKRDGRLCELTDELAECIPDPADTEDRAESRELGRAITGYLNTLSEERQVIFVKRYFYAESISDIAGELCLGESKVKTALHRSRKGLRQYLQKKGYEI